MPASLEDLAARLEADPDFKVLRRLVPPPTIATEELTKIGIILDVETTGLNPAKDEIISLAMQPFRYTGAGRIVELLPAFDQLREPSFPISAEITALTGIDPAAVAGKTIDPAAVAAFVAPAAVIIAHKAEFDRRFVERAFGDVFVEKAWACSQSGIPWREHGLEGSRLSYLAMDKGWFFDAHRALDDCIAVAAVLGAELGSTGASALDCLLKAAKKPTYRVWAIDSPYDSRDALKARGYYWSPGDDGRRKGWFIDLFERDDEVAWLREFIIKKRDPEIQRITAFDRYSVRG